LKIQILKTCNSKLETRNEPETCPFRYEQHDCHRDILIQTL